MIYRYGDATPFPLGKNFLDTLEAATDACVALFAADVSAEGRRARAEEVRARSEAELARLDELAGSIEETAARLLPPGAHKKAPGGAPAAAARIAQNARRTIKQERARIRKRRDAAIQVALGCEIPSKIREAAEPLLVGHELPATRWQASWSCVPGEAASAALAARMPHGIVARFGVKLDRASRFGAPVPVSLLDPELAVMVPGKKRGIRKLKLQRFLVTAMEHAPDRESIRIQKRGRKPRAGYHILLGGEEVTTPRITPVSAAGEVAGESLPIPTDVVLKLRLGFERTVEKLIAMRSELIEARLSDRPIEELDCPAELAEAILNAISPVVRQVRIRSRVPGQLILKRDLEGGRREELYIPREALRARFAQLPEKHRRYFDALGLGADSTVEFARRRLPLSPEDSALSDDLHDSTPTVPVERVGPERTGDPSDESAA